MVRRTPVFGVEVTVLRSLSSHTHMVDYWVPSEHAVSSVMVDGFVLAFGPNGVL